MAWTQAHIDALKEAIGSGARTVMYEGAMTTYRNLDEMRATLAMMEAEVTPAARRVRGFRLTGRTGY